MLFNSFPFLVFLPLVLAIYHLLPHKGQNRFLLLASCLFYASWDWRFLAPLLVSTSIDYWCARRMEERIVAGAGTAANRRYLVLSVTTNLALLGFFKYCNFFADSLHQLLASLGWTASLWTLQVVLPVGISFYTFQALSYTIDVYRGELHATRSFADFLLCVLYFPHLVAGPIQRANNLLPQITNPRRVTREQVEAGVHLIVWGFFKKVFIADNLAPVVSRVFTAPSPDGFTVLMGIYAFAFQIYGDFSGYTDIARGTAKLMGFEFMLNFNLPYLSANPQQFWSRWHISLSTWFRDYLYIPLGGSRGGVWRTSRNLLLTMIVAGFWHGAAWTFLLWGLYHGILLVAHRLLEPKLRFGGTSAHPLLRSVSHAMRVAFFFQFICYGWLIFRASSIAQVAAFTRSLFSPYRNLDLALSASILWIILPLGMVQLYQHLSGRLDFLGVSWMKPELRVAVYSVLLYMAFFRGGLSEAFIYFQF